MSTIFVTLLVTVCTLPMLTLILLAFASYAAAPRRRLLLALLALLVIAVGEWSLPLGLCLLFAVAILARADLLASWQTMRAQWRWPWSQRRVWRQQHVWWRRAQVGLERLLLQIHSIRRLGGVRPWVAAQALRLALACTPHYWSQGAPAMRGMLGIPLTMGNITGRTPTIDEAAQALKHVHLIVDAQNDGPTEPALPVTR
ncbi:MAG: hypothetical protein H0X24_01240 [Ktedonobacterales bacterium]|nr:hypothetical protein [Ktedonobacterales bacterium]